MAEHILFLTGKLAEPSLRHELEALKGNAFTWEVRNPGISVAALMTADLICRRIREVPGVDRIIVPGKCGGDLARVERQLGVPVQRGPDELKDLPIFLGGQRRKLELDRYCIRIFAEIVEAPRLELPQILRQAARYRDDGADVIDLGYLPGVPFPHLEDCISALHEAGYAVSVDTLERAELLRAGKAGADYVLSLTESTLDLAQEFASVPILIPERAGDLPSLLRAVERLAAQDRRFLADSILDPIHFGLGASIVRYHELRKCYPQVEIMMGIGNLTELTEADTVGIQAMLLGIGSELEISAILTTEVSPHACSAIYEADRARRILHAAHREGILPKGIDASLLSLHARHPFPYGMEEIQQLAADIRDPGYRVQISEHGIHVFNRDGLHSGRDPFELYPQLSPLQSDAPHAFYMGVELARAQIAWQLGKRYWQDEELEWGAARPPSARKRQERPLPKDQHGRPAPGPTLQRKRRSKPP